MRFSLIISLALSPPCHGFKFSQTPLSRPRRSGNDIGPHGGTALAAPLERLTALRTLNLQ